MQTFLPYPSFEQSAAVLDDRRLGKQRVEALQVVRALTRATYGWKNHPAARTPAWRPSPPTSRWRARRRYAAKAELAGARAPPDWLGDERFHRSHRAALLRKDPEHYGPLFPDVDPDQPYHWPVERRGVPQ